MLARKPPQRPSPEQLAALEGVIRLLRPAPLVQEDGVEPLPAEAVAAFPAWPEFLKRAAQNLYSVGKIELFDENSQSPRHIGTGSLVSDQKILTNRHVLDALSWGTGAIAAGTAQIRFQVRWGVPDSEDPVPLLGTGVAHPTEDLALIECGPVDMSKRVPIGFATTPAAVGDAVAAIGYPGKDESRNPFFVEQFFRSIYRVKRIAPGEVIGAAGGTVYHDCSTVGGNSGSPIFSLASAEVVAIHKEGVFLFRNGAVDGVVAGAFVASNL